jgi:hypothetical protein
MTSRPVEHNLTSVFIDLRGHKPGPVKPVVNDLVWINYDKIIHKNIDNIRDKLRQLNTAYHEKTLVQFDDVEDSLKIQQLIIAITELLNKIRDQIMQIHNQPVHTADEEQLRNNYVKHTIDTVRDLSIEFTNIQQEYNSRFEETADHSTNIEQTYPIGLTQAQLQQVNNRNNEINQRNAEIITLADSINELHSIFKDFAVLTIDQGILLDNIEANCEATQTNVIIGTEQLVQASNSQKSSRKPLFCLLIYIIFAVFISIVTVKIVYNARNQ